MFGDESRKVLVHISGGTAVAQWLRCCATNQKKVEMLRVLVFGDESEKVLVHINGGGTAVAQGLRCCATNRKVEILRVLVFGDESEKVLVHISGGDRGSTVVKVLCYKSEEGRNVASVGVW